MITLWVPITLSPCDLGIFMDQDHVQTINAHGGTSYIVQGATFISTLTSPGRRAAQRSRSRAITAMPVNEQPDQGYRQYVYIDDELLVRGPAGMT